MACPLKDGMMCLEDPPLLSYGTINSDATMERVMPSHATNGSIAGNGVLCNFALIVMSCSNITTVGSGISFQASLRFIQCDYLARKPKHSSTTF